MTDFISIFQPGMQYVREQRDFDKIRVVEAPSGAPGTTSIDLDAGTAIVVAQRCDATPEGAGGG